MCLQLKNIFFLAVSPAGEDVRRSRRHRMKPLAYWKLENPMYTVTDSGRPTECMMGCMCC